MQTYGAFDAKTHFSKILRDIEQGESVIITRHGREIAIIKPLGAPSEKESKSDRAVNAIRKMRKGVTLGKNLSIKDLINEGRR